MTDEAAEAEPDRGSEAAKPPPPRVWNRCLGHDLRLRHHGVDGNAHAISASGIAGPDVLNVANAIVCLSRALSAKQQRIARKPCGNTGYTAGMAKVMISLPDEFLARVDAQANAHGSTRSATIRELAEVGLGERQRRLSEQMSALEGAARGHGGNAVRDLKAGRPR